MGVGGRFVLIGVAMLLVAAVGFGIIQKQAIEWDRVEAFRLLDVETAKLQASNEGRAFRPDPDALKTSDEKYGGYRLTTYIAGGVGVVFVLVGIALGASPARDESEGEPVNSR